jgi:two-component system, sensor histidine kinase and response regulator
MIKKSILTKWSEEFNETLLTSNFLYLALFTIEKELLFASKSMKRLFKNEPHSSFINPSFDTLLKLDYSSPLIFEGFLTIGDYSSVNTSIWTQIYRKEDEILILGGVNSSQLIEQNEIMHQLNREVSNLQRQLIKEKHALENTLARLAEANKKLTVLNADKDRFISILAHDLKSPFTGLLGWSEVLLENMRVYDINKIEELVIYIRRSAKSAYNLLEDLLLWARAQSDMLPFDREELDLKDILETIVEIFDPVASNKNISVSYSIDEEIIVIADLNMLNTILRNLVSNAIKFSNRNGEIVMKAERNSEHIKITVSDNGVGIPSDVLPELFNISQNYTTPGTSGEKGTGLGLLLCQELVEKHGGKIWADSIPGKGSQFSFTIPQ